MPMSTLTHKKNSEYLKIDISYKCTCEILTFQ